MPQVTLVVAVADNGVIGRDGGLPWRLPEDLRRFKAQTLGRPVLMGRRTFESIGRALPGRHNIVLTRSLGWRVPDGAGDATIVHDWDGALRAAGDVAELMVIGGAEVYAIALPRAGRVLLTRVHADVDGDTQLPAFDPAQWNEVSCERHAADERNPIAMSFVELRRRWRRSEARGESARARDATLWRNLNVSGSESRSMASKKKAKRTVLYSSAGKKLYAKRDAKGKFKDIQSYARAHAADLRRTAKDEAPRKAAAKKAPASKVAVRKAPARKVAASKVAAKKAPARKK